MPKRGRPTSFDRDKALRRAMEVFWAHGYEGATLKALQEAMGGISPPSFYHAFGSKERLFEEVADLYVETIGEPSVRALNNASSARAGIEAMLRLTAKSFSSPGKPRGCLLVLGATRCAPANKGPENYLKAIRQRAPEVIKRRLECAVADGEFAPDIDVAGIAAFYATVVHGLGVRAGDGVPQAALMAAVDGAMAAWPQLTAKADMRVRKPGPA